jgi:hypothetical protein
MSAKGQRARRQIFVFTPQEKKAIACLVGALLLGLATQHYREAHPRKPPPPSARQQYQEQRAKKAAAAYARSARGSREATAPRPRSSPAADDNGDDDE